MGRKRQSGFEDIVDIVSRLPWWVGLALALTSYVTLNYIAGLDVKPANPDPQLLGQYAGKQLGVTLAYFGKIVLPAAFVFGAILSAFKQRRCKNVCESVQKVHHQIDPLNNLSWEDFERLVAGHYRKQGYSVTEKGGVGPDGGIDLLLSKEGKTVLVQCKHWKTFKVGVQIVREQFGIMVAEGADETIIVTSGQFTEEAINFAAEKPMMTLIGGDRLRETLRISKKTISAPANTEKLSSPSCPKCSAPMIEKTATKGKWVGKSFWGCSRYPACKGIIQKN